MIGILEIAAGELELGVTRFMAVAVKTFILTLGTVSKFLEYGVSCTIICGTHDITGLRTYDDY